MLMKVNAPCKDCEKRQVGCHSTCEPYIKFAQERKEMNEAKVKEIEEGYYLRESIARMKRKRGKRNG